MRLLGGLAAAFLLAACAQPAKLPRAPVAAGDAITVRATPVPLFPKGGGGSLCVGEPCGTWIYAGGLDLTSPDTSRLHGLSDLEINADRLVAVSDVGDVLEARLVLGPGGQPVGLAEARLRPLTGLDGRPMGDKKHADAEGLAILPNGDRLVSFEGDHRIWLYPRDGGPPRPAPHPAASFPANGGMEALAPDPARGPDAYLVGGEEDGRTWLCRLTTGCEESVQLDLPKSFALTAARRFSGERTAWLLRAFTLTEGARAEVRVTDANGRLIDRMRLQHPATVDNFEGLAVTERPGAPVRFYLLVDDNFNPQERTLLMAFDWTPPDGQSTP